MLGFIVMGILAALDAASGGSTPGTSPGSIPLTPLQPLSSPVTVQLGGPDTSKALQGTTFTFTSTQTQALDTLNKVAPGILSSPDSKTAIIQANTPGISRYIVLSQTAAKDAGVFGATSGAVGIQASGSKSIRYNL